MLSLLSPCSALLLPAFFAYAFAGGGELARAARLDVGQFEEDLKSGAYEAAVEADLREAQQQGISGTPTFVVNGTVIAGLQPLGVFERTIEQAKREAGGG